MSKEGWLEREVTWSVFNPWQRRYFVLKNNALSWHDGPESVGERGKGKAIPWVILPYFSILIKLRIHSSGFFHPIFSLCFALMFA